MNDVIGKPLSDTERAIVDAMIDGKRLVEIATDHGVSYKTIKAQALKARRKLGASTLMQLCVLHDRDVRAA